jgi:hypothetical protein
MKALTVVLIMIGTLPALGAEYFVNKQGNNANNGLTKDNAFLTIRKGLDAIKAGDTLTIGAGEYREKMERTDIGNLDVDTVIRAEVPGTVLLRGDVPAPEFKKVAGYRFVYAASLENEPQAVLEHNNLHTMLPKANVPELDFDPGFFHYDATAKRLYISNQDLSDPDQCRYTLAVTGTSGFALHSPKRVIIDGLAATGFYPGWGILLGQPVSCTVRNCVCFLNVGGIVLEPNEGLGKGDGGSDNVVEKCVAYGNTFGGIVRYGANNDVVRDCYTYKNVREGQEHFGVMHYSGMTGPLLFKDNISWGHNFDYSVKQGNQQERLENCVGLGFTRISTNKMTHNLIGGDNEYDRGANAPADTILLVRERNLDKDFEFADPLNLDFRMQPDSRFRGTVPDGSDRGPYQYKKNIFYLSPAGDDQADGLYMRKPWRTLSRAFRSLKPGDTLYLAKGEYAAAPLNKVGDSKSLIMIRGRSRDMVVVKGKITVTGGAGIAFERLNFSGGVSLNDSRDLTFKNCTFFSRTAGLMVDRVAGLKVTHCVFAGVPLNIKSSNGVFLSGNIYANAGKHAVELDAAGAILYSDYNSYQDKAQCWKVKNAKWPFASLQKQHDRYSRTLKPKFAVIDDVPRLEDDNQFRSIGPHSTVLGIYHEYDAAPKALDLVGPFLHSASDTTANIEWWLSQPATCSLAWGKTPEMKNVVSHFRGLGRFNTFSLTGLEPGRTYHFKIVSADASRADGPAVLKPENATLTFKTAAAPADPRVYYVAPDGNDGNDGLSCEKAFRTICRAADRVGPGDTVLIAAGGYPENVRIRAAGTPKRPITFRCVTGAKANMLAGNLPRSFEVILKPDNRFDGLYFRQEEFWREGFVVRQSPRVQITRCLNTMVDADESPEMLIRNCMLHGGWNSVTLSRCPNSLVENNVFIMTILRQLVCNSPARVRRNVFCECVRNKTSQTLLELSENVTETDNCFYLRWPEEEKLAVNNLPLPIYRAMTGSNALAANPMMPGTPGRLQGWQQSSDEDFDKFFTTNPELVARSIGLQAEAFDDFHLSVTDWPYDQAWAEEFLTAEKAAAALAKDGKDAEALAAYTDLAKNMAMSDRLKSDVLGKASLCAQKLRDYDKAMQLAKGIPVAPLSMHRQMQSMLEQEQYDALLAAFTQKAMGGRNFHQSLIYPEQEDVMADLYYYRALAYIHTGNLEAAEADLRVMNEKRTQLSYRSGEAIHDLTWLRLGDFYRTHLKDDDKALEAYLNVCDRTTWAPWGTPQKPVLTGAGETLAKATEAACDILRKQGKLDKVKELKSSLTKAQADAVAALWKDR